MFDLKPLDRDAVPRALEKAERYRLLNEPSLAESICLDILAVSPSHQEALVSLLLARTECDHPPFNGQLLDVALRPVALVALSDELRPDAAAVLAEGLPGTTFLPALRRGNVMGALARIGGRNSAMLTTSAPAEGASSSRADPSSGGSSAASGPK